MDTDVMDPALTDAQYLSILSYQQRAAVERAIRSDAARLAAKARWSRYPKSERKRYARAIRAGKPAPRLRRKRNRRKRI